MEQIDVSMTGFGLPVVDALALIVLVKLMTLMMVAAMLFKYG